MASAIASVTVAYSRWRTTSEKYFTEKVRKIVDEYMKQEISVYTKAILESDEFRQVIEDAIDRSKLNKNMQRLILILCTNDDKLKSTAICQGLS